MPSRDTAWLIGTIAVALITLITQLTNFRTDVRTSVEGLRSDVRTEIGDLEAGLRAELGDLETGLRAELGDLETGVRTEIGGLQSTLTRIENNGLSVATAPWTAPPLPQGQNINAPPPRQR